MNNKFKYVFYIIFVFILGISLDVEAISCNSSVLTTDVGNFRCSGIVGDKLTFTFNGVDYSNYFKLWEDGSTIELNPLIAFPTDIEIASIEVKDSASSTYIKIKNSKYIKTTTTTTTTVPLNTVVITFDDGNELTPKRCTINTGEESCVIVFPKLNTEGFNGWGTQKTCKEGIVGSISVKEDSTYYVCYNNEEEDVEVISNKLKLKSLVVKDKSNNEEINYGNFNVDSETYSFKVLNSVENIIVEALVEDEDVVVKVSGNENLKVGVNEVLITLVDNNENKKVYKLNVERLEEGEKLDSIHYLSNLIIGGYEIDFAKDKFEYYITIENNIKQVLIEKTPLDENDTVIVRGNENLENNSKIYIDVTGSDDTTTTYTINILKESDSNLLLIIIIALVILLILVVLLIIFIKKNKGKDKRKEKLKKAKDKVKQNIPEVLVTENKNDDIEVLKF